MTDPIIMVITAYLTGFILFFISGFVFMHRGILGETPKLAALSSLAILAGISAYGLWKARPFKGPQDVKKWLQNTPKKVTAILMAMSLIVAILGCYGYGNNQDNIKVNQAGWSQTQEGVPVWAYQSDRKVHLKNGVFDSYLHGFPPKKVNHRGTHITQLFVTLITGDMNEKRTILAVKTYSWPFFFIIAYSLFAIGRYVFSLPYRLALLAGVSGLIFSPLKLPLFELSPTYRGFFSASGTFYHSETMYISSAVSFIGVFWVLIALTSKQKTYALGAMLISGAFFLKPSFFTILAPSIFALAVFRPKIITRNYIYGLLILLAVPIIWFGYIHLTGSASNINDIIDVTHTDRQNIFERLQNNFFQGYAPRLKGRFPLWIEQSTAVTFIATLLLSFAAFIIAGGNAIRIFLSHTRMKPKASYAFIQQHLPVFFFLGFFLIALFFSLILVDPTLDKSFNWKWSAAGAYILSLPLFIKAISLIPNVKLRILSWSVYIFHIMQGAAYLYYFFWYSRLL